MTIRRSDMPRISLLLVPMLLLGFNASADAALKSKVKKTKAVATSTAVSPCTDYYDAVNGAWLKSHPAPSTGSISTFDAMLANARSQERALLVDAAATPRNDGERALGTLWTDGMNLPGVDAAGSAPLQPLFDRIAKIKKPKDVAAAIADLHAAGVPVLFNFSADVDLKDFDRQLGYANQGGLGLPDPDYYTRPDADTRALLGRYRTYVETILKLSGTPADKVSDQSNWILGIEIRLAQASLPLVQLRDPNNAYKPVTLAELKKSYPNLAFDKFLSAQHAADDHISLAHSGFFQAADGLIAGIPVEQWQAYLRFHVASSLAPYLSQGFQEAHFQLYDRVLDGDQQPLPRDVLVMNAIDRALGDPMGHAYAERYLPQAAKDAATRVADGLRAAAKNAIAQSKWMDDPTRAAAQAKLDKLHIEIGESSHNSSISGLTLGSGNFATDMLAIAAWSHRRDMAAIGKRTNERSWPVLAQIPDVSFDLVQNRIIVTAAFLQPPVFDSNASAAQQFGSLGSLIGHQLQYAFDGKGRFLDADGKLRDWWTPAASNAYMQRTTPIVAQYNAYPAIGAIKVNGQLTRDENLADLAGVELALDAFHAASGAQPAAKGMEREFFAAYATVWQRNTAANTATAEAASSVQSPAKYRVDGVLANVPEFGKTYACKAGQPLQEKAPVSIWR